MKLKAVTTARISPRDNDRDRESDRARCGIATARRAAGCAACAGLYDESDEEGIFFRITSRIGLHYFYDNIYYIIILSLYQILFPKSMPDSIHSRNTSNAARHYLMSGSSGHVVVRAKVAYIATYTYLHAKIRLLHHAPSATISW